jgi:hypothetical protein
MLVSPARPQPDAHVSCSVQAAFADIQARYSQASADAAAAAAAAPGRGRGSKWPRALPEHSTATYAQLLLLHGAGWPNHIMWEHWQAAHPAGSLALFAHMKVSVSCSSATAANGSSSSSSRVRVFACCNATAATG